MPIFAALVCLVRYQFEQVHSFAKPHNELEAISLIEDFLVHVQTHG